MELNLQIDEGSDDDRGSNENESHLEKTNYFYGNVRNTSNEHKAMDTLEVKKARGRPKGSKNSAKPTLDPPKPKLSNFADGKDAELAALRNELKLRSEEVESLVNDVALKSGKLQEQEKHISEMKKLFDGNNMLQQINAKDDMIKQQENTLNIAKKEIETLNEKIRAVEGRSTPKLVSNNDETLLKDIANKDYLISQQAAELQSYKMQVDALNGDKLIQKENNLQMLKNLKAKDNEIAQLKQMSQLNSNGPGNNSDKTEVFSKIEKIAEQEKELQACEEQIEELTEQLKAKDENIVKLVASYRQLKKSQKKKLQDIIL